MSANLFESTVITTIPEAGDVHQADTTQAVPAEEAAPDPSEEIINRYNLGVFKDVDAALDIFSRAGQPQLTQQPQYGNAPVQQPEAWDDIPDEDETIDDFTEEDRVEKPQKRKPTKRERILEQKLTAANRELASHRQQLEQQVANEQRALAAQVEHTINDLKSPVFGVTGNRSEEQVWAAKALIEKAIKISEGSKQFGSYIPIPDAIRLLAARRDKAAPKVKEEAVGLEPRSPSGGQFGPATLNARNVSPAFSNPLLSYRNDPGYQAASRQLLKRS